MHVFHDRGLIVTMEPAFVSHRIEGRFDKVAGVKNKMKMERPAPAENDAITVVLLVLSQLGIDVLEATRRSSPRSNLLELVAILAIVLNGHEYNASVGCSQGWREHLINIEARRIVTWREHQGVSEKA